MSADMRLMWYLKRLGTIQMVDEDLSHDSPEQCKVMSFIPREVENHNHSDNSAFVMDAFTRVFFLTAVYNMVYCLDMSPSNCSVVSAFTLDCPFTYNIKIIIICLGHSEKSCYA